MKKKAQATSDAIAALVKRKEDMAKKRTAAYDKRKADNDAEEKMKAQKKEKVEVIKREIQMRQAKKESAKLKKNLGELSR